MENWRVVHSFEDQASGVILDRPGMQQALGLARERRFDLLLVYRVDRLSGRCASFRRSARSSTDLGSS
jgi:DNA invertase Pin-like site-specific DNA recombinase